MNNNKKYGNGKPVQYVKSIQRGKKRRRIGYKTKRKIFVVCVLLVLFLIVKGIWSLTHKKDETVVASTPAENIMESIQRGENKKPITQEDIETLGWELQLINHEFTRKEDLDVALADIDEYRKIDERILDNVNQMLNDMREAKVENLWVQSAYRSYSTQKEVFNKSVQDYMQEGKSKKEAEELTRKKISVPGTSEHELGLAIDFNMADESFAEMKGFDWLERHAKEYGFVLRYPKGKEDITKIQYEPWHWRYVGEENAKEMNDMGMCLEEFVEYKIEAKK